MYLKLIGFWHILFSWSMGSEKEGKEGKVIKN